jgi:hypothetical protein
MHLYKRSFALRAQTVTLWVFCRTLFGYDRNTEACLRVITKDQEYWKCACSLSCAYVESWNHMMNVLGSVRTLQDLRFSQRWLWRVPVFWDVMLCKSIESLSTFWKNMSTSFLWKLIDFQWTTQHYIPEERTHVRTSSVYTYFFPYNFHIFRFWGTWVEVGQWGVAGPVL